MRFVYLLAVAALFPAAAEAQFSTIASSGFANPAPVSSYSMFNGATGGYVYHDASYPSANASVDYAWLSGGTGMLTDGVAASRSWNEGALNAPGGIQGEFVGWYMDLTISFYFPTVQHATHMRVNYDISNDGGVGAPQSLWINGVDYVTVRPEGTEPFWADYDLSSLAPSNVESVYFRRSAGVPWMMISEVQFDVPPVIDSGSLTGRGSPELPEEPTATPEPGEIVLLATGLAFVLGAAKVRTRRKVLS